jgi:hypothetical protein
MTERGGLILAANLGQTRAHFATEMEPTSYDTGRWGKALCSNEVTPVVVYDQAHHDVWLDKPKRFEDLPLCKRCAKKAEKLENAA